MIEIKEFIKNNKGKSLKLVIDEGRSKKALKSGKIIDYYPNIFTILVDEKLLSFSYSDVLIKKIIFVKWYWLIKNIIL